MMPQRAAANALPTNRFVWIAIPLALLLFPIVNWALADAAARARPTVLIFLFLAAVLAAAITRPVAVGPYSAGILILGARSPKSLAKALLFAVAWVAVTFVVALVLLFVASPYVPAAYLVLTTHAVLATAMHLAGARVPSRALRHRYGRIGVRMPAGNGNVELIKAIETARVARTERLFITVVDKDGSPVFSEAPETLSGPFELCVREHDWLVPFLGFRTIHLRVDTATPAGVPQVPLDDFCNVIRAGAPRDFLRLTTRSRGVTT